MPFEPTYFPRGGAGGGGVPGVSDMTLITDWVATADPDSRLQTQTHAAGLITMKAAGDTGPAYDGYRENGPGFEVPLLDLFPDFDRLTDTLFFEVDFDTLDALANDTYGVWLGIVDENFANRATADGFGMVIESRGANLFRALSITDNNLGGGGTNNLAGLKDNALYKFWWVDSASVTNIFAHSQFRTVGGIHETGTIASGGTMAQSETNWTIQFRLNHRSTTTGDPDYAVRVYVGRYRQAQQG